MIEEARRALLECDDEDIEFDCAVIEESKNSLSVSKQHSITSQSSSKSPSIKPSSVTAL